MAEALTNIVKHARPTRGGAVTASRTARCRVEVRDDGVGGAESGGRGLVGIADRVDALGGGRLLIESPAGAGTVLVARLPLPAATGWSLTATPEN